MRQDENDPIRTGYMYVKKPLTEKTLLKIGNGSHIHIHVAVPFDVITGPDSRGVAIELERATLCDLTRWRLDDLRFKPYAIDADQNVEFDVQATLSRILADNEVDETVRIPFSAILMGAPELVEDLIFKSLVTNDDNLVEMYDTISLIGAENGNLVLHVHATTVRDDL